MHRVAKGRRPRRGGFQKFSQEGEPSTPHCSYLGFPDRLPADLNPTCCAWNAFLSSGTAGIENSWRPVSLLPRQDSDTFRQNRIRAFPASLALGKVQQPALLGPQTVGEAELWASTAAPAVCEPTGSRKLGGEGRFPQRTPLSPDVGIGPPRWFGVLPAPSQPRASQPLLGCRPWGQDAEPHPCGACGHFPPWRVVRSRDGAVTSLWFGVLRLRTQSEEVSVYRLGFGRAGFLLPQM